MVGRTQTIADILEGKIGKHIITQTLQRRSEVLWDFKDHREIKLWVNQGADIWLRQEGGVGVSRVRYGRGMIQVRGQL